MQPAAHRHEWIITRVYLEFLFQTFENTFRAKVKPLPPNYTIINKKRNVEIKVRISLVISKGTFRTQFGGAIDLPLKCSLVKSYERFNIYYSDIT